MVLDYIILDNVIWDEFYYEMIANILSTFCIFLKMDILMTTL